MASGAVPGRLSTLLKYSGRPTMRVGGTLVTRYSAAEVVDLVARQLTDQRLPQLALGSVNLDHLHHFRPTRFDAGGPTTWLWLADGAPVAWRGARLSGRPWPRVTGADLLEPILEVCADQHARVGFLGGQADTHARLAEILAHRHPLAPSPEFWSPARRDVECPTASARLAAQVRDVGVRVLVVGLGKPRQEQWIQRYAAATGAAVVLAFGASADFLAGKVNRAPRFYRENGLEWLYRLRMEPRRLARRYLVQGPPALLRLRRAVLETGVTDPETEPDTVRPSATTISPELPGRRP